MQRRFGDDIENRGLLHNAFDWQLASTPCCLRCRTHIAVSARIHGATRLPFRHPLSECFPLPPTMDGFDLLFYTEKCDTQSTRWRKKNGVHLEADASVCVCVCVITFVITFSMFFLVCKRSEARASRMFGAEYAFLLHTIRTRMLMTPSLPPLPTTTTTIAEQSPTDAFYCNISTHRSEASAWRVCVCVCVTTKYDESVCAFASRNFDFG